MGGGLVWKCCCVQSCCCLGSDGRSMVRRIVDFSHKRSNTRTRLTMVCSGFPRSVSKLHRFHAWRVGRQSVTCLQVVRNAGGPRLYSMRAPTINAQWLCISKVSVATKDVVLAFRRQIHEAARKLTESFFQISSNTLCHTLSALEHSISALIPQISRPQSIVQFSCMHTRAAIISYRREVSVDGLS